MPLTHAERQQRYRKKHECSDEARHRLAARKRVIRSSNKKYASEEKKERERELQRVRSQRARDKKCLAKLNLKQRKNGQRAMTKAEHDNLLGRAPIPEMQPLPLPPLPRPEPSRAPLPWLTALRAVAARQLEARPSAVRRSRRRAEHRIEANRHT